MSSVAQNIVHVAFAIVNVCIAHRVTTPFDIFHTDIYAPHQILYQQTTLLVDTSSTHSLVHAHVLDVVVSIHVYL